jgi:hypothetical protein
MIKKKLSFISPDVPSITFVKFLPWQLLVNSYTVLSKSAQLFYFQNTPALGCSCHTRKYYDVGFTSLAITYVLSTTYFRRLSAVKRYRGFQ